MPARQDEQTILFSDIRDFTSFTAQKGDEEAYRLVRTFVDLASEQVEIHRGKVVKTYGDGVMTTFPKTEDGLQAAIGMQRSLKQHNEENPEDTISAGIGVNWGGAIRDDDDIFGHAVNFTARLANYANGGQIIVSSNVREKFSDPGEYDFIDLEHREFKGIGRERVYELLWRDEIGRLETKNSELILVLTRNNLAIELSKSLQSELLQVRKELRKEAKQETGIAKFVLEKVESYMDKYLSKIVGWAIAKQGIGLEHSIDSVRAELTNGKLSIFLRGNRALTLDPEEIDADSAREFLTRFNQVKSN